MDPWVDFVGVPKEKIDEAGDSYLDLIQTKEMQSGEIELLFFDEFNRAPAKVRNAVMEVMQFKSINGKVFNNLRMVWGAINPDDDEETYDVDRLDPAQEDRFQVKFELPSEPDYDYFTTKYGDVGSRSVEWWNTVPSTHTAHVSPRRLEYAVVHYMNGGDLTDILPKIVKPKQLKHSIERVSNTTSHHENWIAAPDMYLAQINSRTIGKDIDVAAAFTALIDINLDQAVAYAPTLNAANQKALAQTFRTAMLLRGDTRTTVTALQSIKTSNSHHDIKMAEAVGKLVSARSALPVHMAKVDTVRGGTQVDWYTVVATLLLSMPPLDLSTAYFVVGKCAKINSNLLPPFPNQTQEHIKRVLNIVFVDENSKLNDDSLYSLLQIDPVAIIKLLTL